MIDGRPAQSRRWRLTIGGLMLVVAEVSLFAFLLRPPRPPMPLDQAVELARQAALADRAPHASATESPHRLELLSSGYNESEARDWDYWDIDLVEGVGPFGYHCRVFGDGKAVVFYVMFSGPKLTNRSAGSYGFSSVSRTPTGKEP